jgi:predicted nucleic acid-binding protein
MSSVYVDTSVLGAYYCPEPLSATAEAALRAVDKPVVSLLTEVEFFALIAKKKRHGDFSETKARKILGEFATHLTGGYYRKMALNADHYLRARDLIAQFKTTVRTLDALHLAVAFNEKLSLVTADKAMAAAATRFKLKVSLIA